IGYANRQGGGGGGKISVDPNEPPAITEFDIFTLNVLAGLQGPTTIQGLHDAEDQTAQQMTAIATANNGALTPQSASLIRQFLYNLTRFDSVGYLSMSDSETKQAALVGLMKAYFDRPRLVMVSSRLMPVPGSTDFHFALAVDLLRDALRVI